MIILKETDCCPPPSMFTSSCFHKRTVWRHSAPLSQFSPHLRWLYSLKKHWLYWRWWRGEAERCSWGSLEVILPLSGCCLVISGSCREGRKEAKRKGRAQKEIKGWGWEMIAADYCVAAVHSWFVSQGRKMMVRDNFQMQPWKEAPVSLSHYLWIQRDRWWRDMPFRQGIKKKKSQNTWWH